MITPERVFILGLAIAACTWGAVLITLGAPGRVNRLNLSRLLIWVLGLGPVLVQVTDQRPYLTSFDPTAPTALPTSGVSHHISQAVTLIVLGLSALIIFAQHGDAHQRTGRSLAVPLVLFYLTAVVSAVFSGHGGLTRSLFIAPAAILALYIGRRQTREAVVWQLRWILRVYMVGSLIALAVAPNWATYRVQVYLTDFSQRNYFGVGQLMGVTPHPNVLGPIAVAALLIEVTRFQRGRHWKFYTLAAVAVIVLSESRTAWVAAVVCLLFMAFRRRDEAPSLGVNVLLVGCLMIAAVCVVVALDPSVVGSVFTANVVSGDGRTTAYHYAYLEFRKSILVGYGPNLFGPVYRATFLGSSLGWLGQAHNQLLQTLAECGLLGTLTLVATFFGLVRTAYREQPVTMGLTVPLTVLLFIECLSEAALRNLAPDAAFFLVVVVFTALLPPTVHEPVEEIDLRVDTRSLVRF